MKTISEFLACRRADKIAHVTVNLVIFCAAICMTALTVAVVAKTARIVADTEARCEASEAVCAGPSW